MTSVRVRVLFFGVLKDIAGCSEDHIEVAAGGRMGEIFDRYAQQFPRMGQMASSIVLARNQEFCDRSNEVEDGDEVAFLPPVSGGAGAFTHEISEERCFFALTRDPIDTGAVAR